MFGAGLQLTRGSRGEERLYNTGKARRPQHNNNSNNHHQHRNDHLWRAQSDVIRSQTKEKVVKTEDKALEDRTMSSADEELSKPACEPVVNNLDRFLDSITPSVPAQYLSKTTMRGLRTCDEEFEPYFLLSDLWESFKEWSAYGAGVPLILNDSDSVIQYYVPSLSGIQLYGCNSINTDAKSRRHDEDSDSDFRDSSSDGSSDCEPEKVANFPGKSWNHHPVTNGFPLRLDRLSLRDQHINLQEDSSDEEPLNSQGRLLFEYLEQDRPYIREPLADKIEDLAFCFPELKTLRSCDLLPTSWISVAWYPIYRIPTGPTLKDLDASFLTYHCLHSPLGGAAGAQAPVVTPPSEGGDGVPRMSLPVFGLASYKFKGSLWTPNCGCEGQLANSLSQAADNWLRLLQVSHPDFVFFSSR